MGDIDEQDEASSCIDCGAMVWVDSDKAFASGPDTYLCYACSRRRGGVFDEREDRWAVLPDVTGLPDERRPHA